MHILDSAARKRVSGSEQCQCRNGVSAGASDKPLYRGYKRDAQHRTTRGDEAWLLPCGEKQGSCKPACNDGEILPSRVAQPRRKRLAPFQNDCDNGGYKQRVEDVEADEFGARFDGYGSITDETATLSLADHLRRTDIGQEIEKSAVEHYGNHKA